MLSFILHGLGWPALEDMFQGFPPTHARETAERFTLIASDDDPHIPLEHVRKYEELLGARAMILHHRKHWWQKKLPEVLEALHVKDKRRAH